VTDFKHDAIVRHEALIPFSRDHYVGLVQARHLIQAAKADAGARRKALTDFVNAWDADIAEHFYDEERLLMQLMGTDDQQRLFDEHEQLMQFADHAFEMQHQDDPDPQIVRQIGQCLKQHIRWEERDLFTRLQKQLSATVLGKLQHKTQAIEASRNRS
jgi:hemerythrin-like domain-containing protein